MKRAWEFILNLLGYKAENFWVNLVGAVVSFLALYACTNYAINSGFVLLLFGMVLIFFSTRLVQNITGGLLKVIEHLRLSAKSYKIASYYLHTSLLPLFIISCVLLGLSVIFYLQHDWQGFFISAIIGGIMLLAALVQAYLFRFAPGYRVANGFVPTINFNENYLVFVAPYTFWQHGSVKMNRPVYAHWINEVMLDFYPPCFVLDKKEIIFCGYNDRDALAEFAQRNNIPVSNRVDVWYYLSAPFLDTEFTEEEHEVMYRKLEENLIPRHEVTAIREKIKIPMLGLTFATWEWVHYGQYDVLRARWLTKEFYWYSMEVALRGKR